MCLAAISNPNIGVSDSGRDWGDETGRFSVSVLREVPNVDAQHQVKRCESEPPSARAGQLDSQRT